MSKKKQQITFLQQILGYENVIIHQSAGFEDEGTVKFSVHGNNMVTLNGKRITNEEAEAILNKSEKGDEQ